MSNITENHKLGIFAIFIASALMFGAVSISGIDSAFAANSSSQKWGNSYKSGKSDKYSDHKDGKKKSNKDWEQEIEQAQVSKQSSSCTYGGAALALSLYDNNVAIQSYASLGSNRTGQDKHHFFFYCYNH